MRKLALVAALSAALGMTLCVETASAKAGGASGQRPACRLAAPAPPLKLLRRTVLVESGVSTPTERISRRANYTPVPNAGAREPYFALLDRQPKPASVIVGVGY